MMFGFAQLRRQMLDAELERMAIEMPPFGALRVYLSGAFARGLVEPPTELELVIVQETDEPFHRRADFWMSHLRPRVGIQFLVYTPEEFESLEQIDPLLLEAQRLGAPIVG